jgi:polyisoprenoid-binding protein YceI
MTDAVVQTAQQTAVQAGAWDVDLDHSSIEFVARHLMATKVRGRFTVKGDLAIRGVTKPVTLDADLVAAFDDPYGRAKATFSATTEVAREDWGVSWNQPLANGGFVVSKAIKVEIEVQFILRKDAPTEV